MNKFLTIIFCVMASFMGHYSALAEDLENNYAWVLAGILNQITPQLGETKSLNMLGACAYIMPNILSDLYSVTDERKQTEITNALITKYHQEGKAILDWDSTIAELMIKEVSLEEIKRLDSSLKNDSVRQCIVKSEKISEFIYNPEIKKEIVSMILSKAKGTFAFNRVKVKKNEKSYLQAFETFYRESGNKQCVSEIIDEAINGMLKTESMQSQKNLPSYIKQLNEWKPDFEHRLYTKVLEKATEELSESELVQATRSYRSGILLKYMSVVRNLQLNPSLYMEPYINKFAKFVETQDELIKQMAIKKGKKRNANN